MENLYDVLKHLEARWKEIGDAFGLDEELIDEIDTNDELDSVCMEEVIRHYLQRGDATPTWRGVAKVLELMGETRLAESVKQIQEPGM